MIERRRVDQDTADASRIVASFQTRFPNVPGSIMARNIDDHHVVWLREVAWAGFTVCPSENVRHLVVSLLAAFGDDTANEALGAMT